MGQIMIRSYINGEYKNSSSGKSFLNINPATGEVIDRVDQADRALFDCAIESSQQAFLEWSSMTGAQRGRILNRASRLLRDNNDELARLETLDTGKPLQESLAVDISSGADCIEYFAGVAPTIHGEYINLGESFAYTRREPLGICAGIGAWNYPLQIACWKSAPALACGNVMLFKPAELTPVTANRLAEIYTQAGLPKGVFNVIQGDAEVGQMMTSDPRVSKVSLTGEVGTGKKVMQAASNTLKKVTLELGGKSPLIIFEDAVLDNAVSAAIMANFFTQGEVCSNGTRVFVHKTIADQFVEKLAARVSKMKIGNPMDPDTHVGALISGAHMEKVLKYIESGIKQGARLVCGGNRVVENGLDSGFFVAPAVFTACEDDMQIVREEIFGPVMAILLFETEDEVVRRANDTEFGLSAGVFTRDIRRAHGVINQLQAGTCWINNYNITPIEIPFGGYKQSGIGRENSLEAINHYTQVKSVYVEMGDVEAAY